MNTTRSNYSEILSESSDVFYHVHKIIDSNNVWKENDIIDTINFPKRIFNISTDTLKYLSEQDYEKIRETHFLFYPSRLKCIFLFSDIEDAIGFNKKLNAEIWKVKLLNGKMAKCDQNFYNKWLNGSQNTGHDEFDYWSGNKTEAPLWEILFEGNFRLIKMIQNGYIKNNNI